MRTTRLSLLFLIGLVATLTYSTSTSFSASPPPPPGYTYTGGIFAYYFQNMITGNSGNGVCPFGQSITGFSTGVLNYGMPICTASYWVANGSSIYYNSGNVGIGISSPIASLDIVSSGAAPGTNMRITNGTQRLLFTKSVAGNWNPISANGQSLVFDNDGVSTVASGGFAIVPWSTTAGGIYIGEDGNVGIGTITPSQKLEVVGTIKSTSIEFGNGLARTESRDDAGLRGDAGAKSGFFETSAPVNYPAGASGWWHLIDTRHSNNTNNYALQIAGSFFDQDLYFRKTANSPATGWNKFIAANSAGNVGIGTSTPTSTLSVAGTIDALYRFSLSYPTSGVYSGSTAAPYSRVNADSFHTNGLGVGQTFVEGSAIDANTTISIGKGLAGGQTSKAISMGAGSAFYIDTAGNVGLGTLSPGYGLHVLNEDFMLQGTAVDGPNLRLKNSGNNTWSFDAVDATNSRFRLITEGGVSGSVERLTALENGNVGIGTSAPATRLQVGDGGDGWTNGLTIFSTYPTIYMRDIDHRGVMIHNNGDLLYFLSSGANPSNNPAAGNNWATQANGYWPLYLNLDNNNAIFGGNIYSFGYYYNSDRNFKKDIVTISGALDKITHLEGRYFTWKGTGRRDMGLIAQEVQQVLPEIVAEQYKVDPYSDKKGEKYLTVEYGNLVAPIIEAVKELNTKHLSLEQRVTELQSENEKLQARLDMLEEKMNHIQLQ